MMDQIRQTFYDQPVIVQIVFVTLLASAIFTGVIYGLSAAGLKQATEMIESLKKESKGTMTDEQKGELYAWINVSIWILLFFHAVSRGSIDRLLGGLVIWTVVACGALLVWALKRGQS